MRGGGPRGRRASSRRLRHGACVTGSDPRRRHSRRIGESKPACARRRARCTVSRNKPQVTECPTVQDLYERSVADGASSARTSKATLRSGTAARSNAHNVYYVKRRRYMRIGEDASVRLSPIEAVRTGFRRPRSRLSSSRAHRPRIGGRSCRKGPSWVPVRPRGRARGRYPGAARRRDCSPSGRTPMARRRPGR